TADLADFGVEGGLRYVGDEQFLRKRLAACSVEQFLARPDVHWVMAGKMPFELLELEDTDLDEEDGEEEPAPGAGLDLSDQPILAGLTKILDKVGDSAENAVRQWCFQNGQAPHARLRDAVDALLISAMPAAMYEQATEDEPPQEGDEPPPEPQALL